MFHKSFGLFFSFTESYDGLTKKYENSMFQQIYILISFKNGCHNITLYKDF